MGRIFRLNQSDMAQTVILIEGEEIQFITQQYQVGLYIATYRGKECVSQGSSQLTEAKYHQKLIGKANKRGDKVISSTYLNESDHAKSE